jgi:uncharacterized membrane protein
MFLSRINSWGELILLTSFFILGMLYYKWIPKFKEWLAARKKKRSEDNTFRP